MTTVGVQVVSLLPEILLLLLQGWLLTSTLSPVLFPLTVGVDLLVLSPLKVGRALFFETRVTDPFSARFTQLFRFYGRGYCRCVAWRFSVWCKRLGWSVLLSVPSALLLWLARRIGQNGNAHVALLAFMIAISLLILAIMATELILTRYIPSVYLLIHVPTAAIALRLSRQLSKHTLAKWAQLYLDYAGWSLSFVIIIPIFYVSALFQTARAALVRQLISQNTSKIREHLLKV